MATDNGLNPYKAGSGLRPPHLAGRYAELRTIGCALDAIKGGAGEMGHSPDPTMVIVGPRGVGKTVLLKDSVRQARKRGIYMATVNCDLLSGEQDALISHMFPQGLIGSVIGDAKKLSVAGAFVDLDKIDAELMSALPAFLSKGPLLVVLDEAHNCEPKGLKRLFDNAQECMSMDLPLAVIIAGTPGLEPHLQRCKATYVERSKFLRINTLSREEASDALELPAKEHGRPMEEEALKLLVDSSDRYPYFIQMVGTHAWDVSEQRGGKEITVADARKGIAEADMEREGFYTNRHQEMKMRNLDEHAVQVIGLFRENKGKLVDEAVEDHLLRMNKDMDKDRAIAVVEELQEVGFLWRSGYGLEPGIPSMFDYILRVKEQVQSASNEDAGESHWSRLWKWRPPFLARRKKKSGSNQRS